MGKRTVIGSKCSKCKYLYTNYGKAVGCYYDEERSGTLTRKSCPRFKKGLPFIPRVDGKLAKTLQISPGKPAAFAIYTNPEHILLVTWHIGHDKVGFWKIRFIGILPNGGIAPKQFSPDDIRPAFYGEVSVVGPENNSDLYTSPGYEDDDELDEEGNLVNKPSEIRIYPVRERKSRER